MTDMYILDTPLSEQQREQLEILARQHGYTKVGEYLLALAEQDARETLLNDDVDEDVDVADRLRQALEDVKAGRAYSYGKLREMIDDDTADN
ncbi:MAG: hypothetical protein R3E39_12845 [Anaerolineae bacterium]